MLGVLVLVHPYRPGCIRAPHIGMHLNKMVWLRVNKRLPVIVIDCLKLHYTAISVAEKNQVVKFTTNPEVMEFNMAVCPESWSFDN